MNSGSVLISATYSRIECIIPVMIKEKSILIHAHETEFPVVTANASDIVSDSDNDSKSFTSSPVVIKSRDKSAATPLSSTAPDSPLFSWNLRNVTQRSKSIALSPTSVAANTGDKRGSQRPKIISEAALTFGTGVKLGLFDRQHEAGIVELLVKDIIKDPINHC